MKIILNPLAVYIHWPFCLRICSYCDFVKYKAPSWLLSSTSVQKEYNRHDSSSKPLQKLVEGYQADINRHALYLSEPAQPSWQVSTIFVGGGTPSLAPSWAIAEIVSSIKQAFHVNPKLEVGLPSSPVLLTVHVNHPIVDR
eukprot:m.83882 g.83882  ORF g.83882 m.83882 type:complete len:141 (-) comp14664_c0_seq14:1088-1510(-)